MYKYALFAVLVMVFNDKVEARRMGFFREMQQACQFEYPKYYSNIGFSMDIFCDCYGRGFVQTMTSQQREVMYKNEVNANTYLPFRHQLISQGFGNVLNAVVDKCSTNSKAFDK